MADELPPLLERRQDIVTGASALADIGCGDGWILHALSQRGILPEVAYAIDHDPPRVERAASIDPRIRGVVADGAAVPLPDESVDVVICSQVIEHVDDDRALVSEIARILRPGGVAYIGSVSKRRISWWLYRRDGQWWLDPTHVREYSDLGAFADVLSGGLAVDASLESQIRFPVVDLAIRAGIYAGAVKPDSVALLSRRPALRRIRVPVPGYRLVEAVCHKHRSAE